MHDLLGYMAPCKWLLLRSVPLEGARGTNLFSTGSLTAKGLHDGMLSSPHVITGHSWDYQLIPWLVILRAKGRPWGWRSETASVGGRRLSIGLWVSLSESGHSGGWTWITPKGLRDRESWGHLKWHIRGPWYRHHI